MGQLTLEADGPIVVRVLFGAFLDNQIGLIDFRRGPIVVGDPIEVALSLRLQVFVVDALLEHIAEGLAVDTKLALGCGEIEVGRVPTRHTFSIVEEGFFWRTGLERLVGWRGPTAVVGHIVLQPGVHLLHRFLLLGDAALGGNVEDEAVLTNLALLLAEVEVVGEVACDAGHSVEEGGLDGARFEILVEWGGIPVEV